eukprot:11263115-Prorocentrum_lima.AAC.1
MALRIEAVPEALARMAETCPCHRALFKNLGEHKRRAALEEHYGPGVYVCPLAGKILPELIAGELEQCFEDICSEQEADLHILPVVGLRSLDAAEWNVLITDFRKGHQQSSIKF